MSDEIRCADGKHEVRTVTTTEGVPSDWTCECGLVPVHYDGRVLHIGGVPRDPAENPHA